MCFRSSAQTLIAGQPGQAGYDNGDVPTTNDIPALDAFLNDPWESAAYNGQIAFCDQNASEPQIRYVDSNGDIQVVYSGAGFFPSLLTSAGGGALYAGEWGGEISKIQNGVQTVITNLIGLTGICGPIGNVLYAGSCSDNKLYEINVSTGVKVVKAVGLACPGGLTYHDGNVYVVSLDDAEIKKINPVTGSVESFIGGAFRDIHYDTASNSFVTAGNAGVEKYDISGNFEETLSTQSAFSATVIGTNAYFVNTDQTVSIGSISLPIELSRFDVTTRESAVLLSWTTQSEYNNDFFTVQRNYVNMAVWEDIAVIDSKSPDGNSTGKLAYEFVDEPDINDTYYYRLKQTDFNGLFTFGPVRSVKFEGGKIKPSIKVFPNPAAEKLYVQLPEGLESARCTLFDVVGRPLITHDIPEVSRGFLLELNFNEFARGTYFLNVTNPNSGFHYPTVLVLIKDGP